MKNIFKQFLVLLAFSTLIIGCESDDEMANTNVTAVEDLYAPEDNAYFNLEAQSEAVFEWQAARAEDNGVVLYEVVFDAEGGDFSDPVYVIPSDGNGMQRSLTLPFSELNAIAGMAGIEPENKGNIKWTVHSSKGINVVKSEISRTIEVERPGGFPPPDELFLTGSATEAGETIDDAIAFKKLSANRFEIYTSLSEGEYQFITRRDENHEMYGVDGEDLVAETPGTHSGEETVYRIQVDFSDGSVNMTEVEKVELWFAPSGEFLFELPYAENGIFEAENEYIEFQQEDWGRDERYKFRFTFNDGGESVEEWYGSTNADNQRPNADSSESYWYMVPVTDDRWNNTFKFGDEVDMSNANIQVWFNTEVDEYTHSIELIEE